MTLRHAAERTHAFPFLEDVIVLADAATTSRDPRKIVQVLSDGLRGLIGVLGALPPELLRTGESGHVRRELYRSPTRGYQILAITWAPGQGSTVHDHADTWGVEAILRGQLEVLDYRIAARHKALTELRPAGQHQLLDGQVIGLLPPHDLHSCRNARPRETAIYGKHLERVKRYVHVEHDLYRPERVELVSV